MIGEVPGEIALGLELQLGAGPREHLALLLAQDSYKAVGVDADKIALFDSDPATSAVASRPVLRTGLVLRARIGRPRSGSDFSSRTAHKITAPSQPCDQHTACMGVAQVAQPQCSGAAITKMPPADGAAISAPCAALPLGRLRPVTIGVMLRRRPNPNESCCVLSETQTYKPHTENGNRRIQFAPQASAVLPLCE